MQFLLLAQQIHFIFLSKLHHRCGKQTCNFIQTYSNFKHFIRKDSLHVVHFQQYIKRVREDTIRKWKWENAAAGFTCAAAAASSQRAEDPRHQVCLPAAPGRIPPPSTYRLLLLQLLCAFSISLFVDIYMHNPSVWRHRSAMHRWQRLHHLGLEIWMLFVQVNTILFTIHAKCNMWWIWMSSMPDTAQHCLTFLTYTLVQTLSSSLHLFLAFVAW